MEKPFVFRPFAGHARSVCVGGRDFVEGDLIIATDADVARLASTYGGREAFEPFSPRQVEALAQAAGYKGEASGLIPHLKGLAQPALNRARDQVRGIGDEPAPPGHPRAIVAHAAPAAPIPPAPAPEPAPESDTAASEPAPDAALEEVPSRLEADLRKLTLAELLSVAAESNVKTTSDQRKTKGGIIEAMRAAGYVKEG